MDIFNKGNATIKMIGATKSRFLLLLYLPNLDNDTNKPPTIEVKNSCTNMYVFDMPPNAYTGGKLYLNGAVKITSKWPKLCTWMDNNHFGGIDTMNSFLVSDNNGEDHFVLNVKEKYINGFSLKSGEMVSEQLSNIKQDKICLNSRSVFTFLTTATDTMTVYCTHNLTRHYGGGNHSKSIHNKTNNQHNINKSTKNLNTLEIVINMETLKGDKQLNKKTTIEEKEIGELCKSDGGKSILLSKLTECKDKIGWPIPESGFITNDQVILFDGPTVHKFSRDALKEYGKVVKLNDEPRNSFAKAGLPPQDDGGTEKFNDGGGKGLSIGLIIGIVLIILIVICVICVGVYYFVFRKEPEKKPLHNKSSSKQKKMNKEKGLSSSEVSKRKAGLSTSSKKGASILSTKKGTKTSKKSFDASGGGRGARLASVSKKRLSSSKKFNSSKKSAPISSRKKMKKSSKLASSNNVSTSKKSASVKSKKKGGVGFSSSKKKFSSRFPKKSSMKMSSSSKKKMQSSKK